MKLNLSDTLFPVGNGAGVIKSGARLSEFLQTQPGFAVVGSVSMEPKHWDQTAKSAVLHAGDLPNPGIRILQRSLALRKALRQAKESAIPVILSILDNTPQKYAALGQTAQALGFAGVECNLGLPVMTAQNRDPSYACFESEVTRQILVGLQPLMDDLFVSVKVLPMTDPKAIPRLAKVLSEFPELGAVVTQNLFPNALRYRRDGTPEFEVMHGGWLSRPDATLLHQTLGQITQWRQALPPNIAVWGIGGVAHSAHLHQMIKAGAEAIQVTRSLLQWGFDFMEQLRHEYHGDIA